MKRRQVLLNEAWSGKRGEMQAITDGNEQFEDTVDLPQPVIDPELTAAITFLLRTYVKLGLIVSCEQLTVQQRTYLNLRLVVRYQWLTV